VDSTPIANLDTRKNHDTPQYTVPKPFATLNSTPTPMPTPDPTPEGPIQIHVYEFVLKKSTALEETTDILTALPRYTYSYYWYRGYYYPNPDEPKYYLVPFANESDYTCVMQYAYYEPLDPEKYSIIQQSSDENYDIKNYTIMIPRSTIRALESDKKSLSSILYVRPMSDSGIPHQSILGQNPDEPS
jgi:hypothetical protein